MFRFYVSPVILFENENDRLGNEVTLSQSAANFAYIEIFYKDKDGLRNSVKVKNGQNASLAITYIVPGSGSMWHKARAIRVNGTSITTLQNGSNYAEGQKNLADSSNGLTAGSVISIVRVIGHLSI